MGNVVDFCQNKKDQRKNNDDDLPSSETDPLAALERKQNEIFSRLQCLKDTVKQLNQKYKSTDNPSSLGSARASGVSSIPLISQEKNNMGEVIHDIVISADPARPPLSLLTLYKVACDKYRIYASSFIHSSVTSLPPNLRQVFQNGGKVERDSCDIAITIVWKKVENGPTLMVAPHKQTTIEGESNIARYLQRLLNPQYDNCAVAATKIDEWLDLAEQYVRGNKKENAAVVKAMNSRLGSSPWLVGESMSLADIMLWSVINKAQAEKDCPSNVKTWLKECDKSPYFDLAKSVLLCK